MSQLPWCVIGDFNDILSPDEKRGRVEHPHWLMRGFREVVNSCNLSDVALEGYLFTWARSKESFRGVEERFDRAMVSPSWNDLFPEARLFNLIAPISDNNPIVLHCKVISKPSIHKCFKFENAWLVEPELDNIVTHG